MSIAAPTVLVTGASSGIGQATARRFTEEGFRVFGTSRHRRPDERGVEMLELDVRSDASVERCIRQVLERTEHIDVLVNNAGVMHEGFAEETPLADAEAIFAVNIFGTARVTNAVLPGMRGRHDGRIINIGSLAAWVGEPGQGYYAASKAAVARYTEALRHEVWHCGIRVTLVEPTVFATNVLAASSTAEATIGDYDGPREKARRTLHESLAEGGDPGEAADLIVEIARAHAPHPRYGVGPEAFWLPHVKSLLPGRVFDQLLRHGFDLPGRP